MNFISASNALFGFSPPYSLARRRAAGFNTFAALGNREIAAPKILLGNLPKEAPDLIFYVYFHYSCEREGKIKRVATLTRDS